MKPAWCGVNGWCDWEGRRWLKRGATVLMADGRKEKRRKAGKIKKHKNQNKQEQHKKHKSREAGRVGKWGGVDK